MGRHMNNVAALLAAVGCMAALGAAGAEPTTGLPHTRAAWASAENDLGETDPGLRLTNLTLVLNRPPERQTAFETLLAEQQDPASPRFHRWLTPAQIGEQFGPPDGDIAAVSSWLRSQGLRVDDVAGSRVRIEFSGPAANVAAAFGTPLHTYLVDGEEMISPAAAPRIPSSLARLLQTVQGLQTVRERPQHHSTRSEIRTAALGEQPATTACSGTACSHYIGPSDFASIYDVKPVYLQGVDGTGQTIAIVGRASVYLPDFENFQTFAGLAVKDPVIVIPPNGVDPGPPVSTDDGTKHPDQSEATLDVTRAASVAPGATIDLVISANTPTASGVGIASRHVVDTNLAQVMSISFSSCEQQLGGPAIVSFWDSIFSEAAAQGISVLVSSGDSGAAGCAKAFAAPSGTQVAATNAICASSYVTCIGGTQFADTATPGAYWSATNSGGRQSAFGYIPEGAWNEPLDASGNPQIAATGGGVSAYVPTPSWQVGTGVPGTQGRYTPDISFSASVHDGYLNCSTASGATCVAVNGSIHFVSSGGTSAGAPSMAGIAALLDQKMAGAQGNLNPRLYSLASNPGNRVFHDITPATSGDLVCDPSTPGTCNNTTPGPTGLAGGLPGYSVGPGYDMATGLGSIDVANLLASWAAASSPGTPANSPGPFSGLWYNPNESGWGIGFTQRRNIVFATWFTYDNLGNPKWYVASSCPLAATNGGTGGTCSGSLYEVGGPAFFGTPFNPSLVHVAAVGSLTVSFRNVDAATMSYTVNGQSRTVEIVRQVFQSGATLPAVDYTDLWWNPNESGWGLLVSHEYGVMFLAWFVYDGNGKPLWYVASDCVVNASGCTGSLYSTTGPAFGPSFNPSQVHVNTVGTITLTFSDPNNGIAAFTVNGVSGSKSITRQLF